MADCTKCDFYRTHWCSKCDGRVLYSETKLDEEDFDDDWWFEWYPDDDLEDDEEEELI